MPNGIRMGSPAMTTRGLIETDFEKITDFVDCAIQIAIDIHQEIPSAKLQEFKAHMMAHTRYDAPLKQLREEVIQFAKAFPVVGFDELTMKYS
jgi:glycine hydroxymethyltransferase